MRCGFRNVDFGISNLKIQDPLVYSAIRIPHSELGGDPFHAWDAQSWSKRWPVWSNDWGLLKMKVGVLLEGIGHP